MDPIENSRESKFFPTIYVLVITILGLVWLWKRSKNLPPGPVNPLTFLNLGKNRFIKLTQFSRDYGPIYSFRVGTSLVVVLNNIEVIREALTKQGDTFSNRFRSRLVDIVNDGTKGSILFSSGEHWKEMRRFGSHAMRTFGVGKRSIGRKINEETTPLIAEFLKQGGKEFNPNCVIGNAVSNIICSISFGERYEYDNTEFQSLLSHFRNLSTSTSVFSIVSVMPFLRYMIPRYKKFYEMFTSVKNFVSIKVKEHRTTLDRNDVRDVIDMYLLETDKQSNGDKSVHFDVARTWRIVQDLFAAGSETTSTSLMWAMALMCHYPEIQEKVFEEVRSVVGVERFPTYEDKVNLPYTDAVIMEIQRFRPLIPLVAHETIRDTSLAGYFIPKGSRIMINIWATGHDPSHWEDPYEFIPERFLSADGKRVLHNDAHIPFGIGPRVCLGESLAKMEIFLFFTSLVQKFRFKVPEGRPLPSLEGTHGIVFGIDPYLLCAEPRI